MLALYACSLTANVAVEIMARTAAGVSVRVAVRADARAAFVGIRQAHLVIR